MRVKQRQDDHLLELFDDSTQATDRLPALANCRVTLSMPCTTCSSSMWSCLSLCAFMAFPALHSVQAVNGLKCLLYRYARLRLNYLMTIQPVTLPGSRQEQGT